MIKEAIDRIVELSQPQELTLSGRLYTSKGIVPVKEPTPATVALGTLTGFYDYISANIDSLTPSDLLIHVIDFQSVALISRLRTPWQTRDSYLLAKCDTLKFPFGQFLDVEGFIIRLQSQFVQDETVAAILKIVGNVQESMIKNFADDGVTQQATVKTCVSKVENVAVPNPVILSPYRTFLEISQPPSRFIFRMRSGNDAPTCALFEADGGSWKNVAVQGIKEWLAEKETGIAIIA
jgi:hypothetical protein